MTDDLKQRVQDFKMLRLPGQMPMMHMGTAYLVNDLVAAVEKAEAENAKLRKHAEAMFNWITGDGEYCTVKDCEACAIGRAYRADFPKGERP